MERRRDNESRRVPRLSERKPYEKPAILGRSLTKGGNILITS